MEGSGRRKKNIYTYTYIYMSIKPPIIKETAGGKTLFIYQSYLQNHLLDTGGI